MRSIRLQLDLIQKNILFQNTRDLSKLIIFDTIHNHEGARMMKPIATNSLVDIYQ
jgi:hypothetical protein